MYRILCLMSGTSLDGLDMAVVDLDTDSYQYQWGPVQTLPYPPYWMGQLRHAHERSEAELEELNADYAEWLGIESRKFLSEQKVKVDFIASHGHTVHHRPEEGYTYQLGNHPAIARAAGVKVICDFRKEDVKLGGQGAPLVPIGDALLFGDYTYCLNLGGFANVSFDQDGKRVAFDIGPCNFLLNHLAGLLGHPYDEEGHLARKGTVIPEILDAWNQLPYYKRPAPKSLGREWVEAHILPVIEAHPYHTVIDILRTAVEHIAIQVSMVLKDEGSCLTTGGGAKNTFLIERVMALTTRRITVPDVNLVDYKEALVFGLLGALKLEGKSNILSSVTGAPYDHSGGIILEP